MNKATRLQNVQTLITYQFNDGDILWEALHVPGAFAFDAGSRNLSNGNKRLALLGDAILKAAITIEWYGTCDTRGRFSMIDDDNLLLIGYRGWQ